MKIQAYRKETLTGAELRPQRLLIVLAVLSLLCLLVLALVPARSHFTEWRAAQRRYNALAGGAGLPATELQLHQIWKEELGVVDRCGSCHLGMAGKAEPLGTGLFKAHPAIPHQPAELGCTVCHGGQGRATRAAAAHGQVRFWEHPLLEGRYAQAACGACHGWLQLPPRAVLQAGASLYAQRDCRRCHQLDRTGRSVDEGAPGTDLSTVGLRGFPEDWHQRHLQRRQQAQGKEPWASSYGELSAEEVTAIAAFLGTRMGAPRFVEAKAVVQERGCRGCHKIHGVGGDEGVDLSNEGMKLLSELDLTRLPGARGLADWLKSKVTDPGWTTAASAMPVPELTAEERELATLYLLSLRRLPLPASQWTRERVRVAKLDQRDFPVEGASLFAGFCSGCHGTRGQGRGVPGQGVVLPAVGNPDVLGLVPDEMLRQTLVAGRPGSKMPSWGEKDGGLRPDEIAALVVHLRSLEPAAVGLAAVESSQPDRKRGRELYQRDCASCHGRAGEGGALGTPLAVADARRDLPSLFAGTTTGKPGTAMGSYRTYAAAELAALLGFLADLPVVAGGQRAGWQAGKGSADGGAPLFGRHCQGCHGPAGVGGDAPRIGAAGFLQAAPDGVIAGTILRGRRGTWMPSFGAASTSYPTLSAGEALDLTAYLRSLQPKPAVTRK